MHVCIYVCIYDTASLTKVFHDHKRLRPGFLCRSVKIGHFPSEGCAGYLSIYLPDKTFVMRNPNKLAEWTRLGKKAPRNAQVWPEKSTLFHMFFHMLNRRFIG